MENHDDVPCVTYSLIDVTDELKSCDFYFLEFRFTFTLNNYRLYRAKVKDSSIKDQVLQML